MRLPHWLAMSIVVIGLIMILIPFIIFLVSVWSVTIQLMSVYWYCIFGGAGIVIVLEVLDQLGYVEKR